MPDGAIDVIAEERRDHPDLTDAYGQDLGVSGHDRLGSLSFQLGCPAFRPDPGDESLQADRHGLDPVRADLRRAALALPGGGQCAIQIWPKTPQIGQLKVDDGGDRQDAGLVRELTHLQSVR